MTKKINNKNKEKEYVKVASFTKDNCTYVVYQPKGEMDENDFKELYEELSKLIYD